jgi:hypothetical protein
MVATDTAATQTHWRIRGEYLENCNCDIGDVSLDGLNVGLIARTPGAMADGNWQVALYVDDRADDDQRGAVQAIFTGSAEGVMANLAPLIGEVLGVRSAAIHWRRTESAARSRSTTRWRWRCTPHRASIPTARSGRGTRIRSPRRALRWRSGTCRARLPITG